jgi:hypothetical protein
MHRLTWTTLIALVLTSHAPQAASAWAQTPQPFPRPGSQPVPQAPPVPAPPSTTADTQASPAPPRPAQEPSPAAGETPTDATLGVPVYPNAQFLGSYDAGRGQRFYLFGVLSSFSEMVTYYRTTLRQRGEVLFETPGTHMFELARFRDESMAFPPSVTIKDYTWGGSPGLANPKRGGEPAYFPTVLQIVPAPAPAR